MRPGARLLAIVALVLAWGSTFAAVKVGLESVRPLLFSGIRSVIGGAVVALAALLLHRRPRLRENLGGYALITLLNVVVFFSVQTFAIDLLPSGLAAVLVYLQPVLTGVLAVPFLGESLGPSKLAGLMVGFAGIVVVSIGAFDGHVSPLGVGLAVLSALIWSLGTIAIKREAERVDAWWAVAVSFLIGGVLLLVGGAATEGTSIDWSLRFGVALGYSALIGTAFSWALWFTLVGAGEASRTAAYIFFVPIVSLLVGAVFLGETLGISLLLGAALVVVGVYLVNRRPAAPARTPASTLGAGPA